MANEIRQTLDIPNGTTFEFQDGKLVFGHESDIVIRTNLGGYKFQKIFSKKGSVQVIPPEGVEFDVDTIEAVEGDVFLNGRVRVRSAHGKTIHFQEGRLRAENLTADQEIVLSGHDIDVAHVKAPRVQLDESAAGTCLIVECQNDLGARRAKGLFRSVKEAKAALARIEGAGEGAAPSAPAPPPPSPERPEPATEETRALDAQSTAELGAAAEGGTGGGGRATASTQEIRVGGERDDGGSALPKSSVFRKRK